MNYVIWRYFKIVKFFFITLLAIYVYGYFMYSHKIRRDYVKSCDTIYILDKNMSTMEEPENIEHEYSKGFKNLIK